MPPLVLTLAVLASAWLALAMVLWLHRPSRDTASLLLRLVPDVAKLAIRLVRDPATPMRYRVALVALVGYLASPIDIIPDFIPGIGSVDDVIVAALVLRWVGRGVSPQRVEELWPGTPEGLAMLRKGIG
jgi:uncharacterized membrane protein YkvA (DUF1232 family)